MTRLFRFAFWAAALFAFVMAVLPQPVELPASDKLQHMAAFFTLTVLGCGAYPRLSRARLAFALIAFGGVIELVQLVPELHRDSEWSDWLADIVAVLGGLAAFWLIEHLRPASPD